jgi:integrase
MREKWAASTTYKQIAYLLVLTRFLAARGVCRTLHYTPHTPRIEDFNRHTIAGQEARSDRLPSDAALNSLADIYRQHAKEPRDRLRAAALAILVVTGLRISELLTLQHDH